MPDWEKAIEILGTSTDQANKRKLHSAVSSSVEMLIGEIIHVPVSKCLLMGWHISNVLPVDLPLIYILHYYFSNKGWDYSF